MSNICTLLVACLAMACDATAATGGPPEPLDSDETLILFPTLAAQEPAQGGGVTPRGWVVHLRGWVFEREDESRWRGKLIDELGGEFELTEQEIRSPVFQSRARAFLADNERGKQVRVEIGGRAFTLPETGADGHFETSIRLNDDELRGAAGEAVRGTSRTLEVKVLNAGGAEVVCPPVRVADSGATIVVCDIDDTIKISNIVGDKARVVRTAMLEAFRPVPGMADLCNRLAATGAEFWYLSASPWQLFEPLDAFLKDNNFPRGGITLREFRVKDERLLNLFKDPREFKAAELRELLARFGGHRFVLIGDTTEHDAEVYALVAREFPDRVARIIVRATPGDEVGRARAQMALRDLPPGTRVELFDDPAAVQPAAADEAGAE